MSEKWTADRIPDQRGRTAIVTGANSGLGLVTARELARKGAAVTLAVRNTAKGEAAVAEIRAAAPGADVTLSALDLGDLASVRDFADRWGGADLDLLVNNAGVEKPFELVDMPLEEWEKVISVNLTGTFLCTREAARIMRADKTEGAIVMISSVHEVIPWEQFSHYCASKGGMKLFAQSIAKELAPHGIRVVSVAPGAIATPINRQVLDDPKERREVESEIPLGRWGEVSDVARAVAWVGSDQAQYVVGATLFVDGGMTLYPKFV